MGFKELERSFREEVVKPVAEGSEIPTKTYQFWLLRLMFEIAGNLDSLVVSYRELVKLNKDKQGKANGSQEKA